MRTNVSAGLRVVAVTTGGERVVEARLGHGEHPDVVLGAAGWAIETASFARVVEDGVLELGYRVRPVDGIRPGPEAVRRDAGVGDGEVGAPHQRVAAYAVVVSSQGVLLTQFNSQTHVSGDWGLPGGGLDEGESPVEGVHREVWEETGQRIELGELLTIQSQHWVGRAPSGGLEDFHAIRIVYAATCSDPAEIVIHDVGGTTSDARWVAPERLGDFRLTSSWRQLAALHELVQPSGSTVDEGSGSSEYDAP